MDALETVPLPPSSQVMVSASSAFFACHQPSATTATASFSLTTLWTPFIPAIFGFVDRLQRAPEDRALHERGVQHVRHAHIDAVDRPAHDLVDHVEPLCRLAGELPVLGIAQRAHPSAVRSRAAASATSPKRRVRPLGVCVMTLLAARHSEAATCQRAAAAAISISRAVAPAVRSEPCDMRMLRLPPVEKSPQTRLRRRFSSGRGEFDRHLAPVAFEFLGDQHRQRRRHALAHLRARDADDHGVVRPDHDPGVDLRRFRSVGGAAQMSGPNGISKPSANAAAGGGDAGKKAAAIEPASASHECNPSNRAGNSNGKTTISSQQFKSAVRARTATHPQSDGNGGDRFGAALVRSAAALTRHAVRMP